MLLGSGRFRAPISSDECRRFEDSWVSDASRRKWNWVLNIFEEWRETRNEAVLKVENSGEPVLNQRIAEMSDEDLDFFLARFVAEVRKEDEQEYPGKTIYEMICSLQCYLCFQRKGPLFLIDKKGCKFRNLNSALNVVLKERVAEGIGSITSKAEVITPDQMEYLWQNGFLGSDMPELLRNTILFVFGNCFALRARQEHRNLRMKNSQLSLHTDESGAEYLQYVEDVSKSNNGGLAHLRIKNKVVRAYENVEKPEHCPVKLYNKYISHVPSETSDNSFYLQPLPKPKGNIWYYKKAAGREMLGNVVKKVMGKAGFDGHFTNHSLRRSCATNLYDNGVPEQVIQETTGHRSVEGVRAYKCTSSAMKRKMSAILNQLESSLGSDHERRNTKKRCDREDAEDQIEQHEVSDKKEVSVCDIGFNALNAESMEERHDKVETKEENCKNIVITTAETKIEICYK